MLVFCHCLFFPCSPGSCSTIGRICLDGVQTSKTGSDLHMSLGFTKGGLPRVLFSMRAPLGSLQPVTLQAPLSMGFSRQAYLSGSHALLQGLYPDPGVGPLCLMSPS